MRAKSRFVVAIVLLLSAYCDGATVKFTGNAPAVAQINTVTPGTVAVGNIFNIIINGKTVTFTATAGNVANVTAGLVAALTSTSVPPPPEFAEITWTDNGVYVTGKTKTAGVPFTQTSSAAVGTGGGAPTNVTATTTTSSGPNDLSIVSNYDIGALPSNNDTLQFEQGSIDVLYGLDQHTISIGKIRVLSNWSGKFGLPETNANGYAEYRGTFVKYSGGVGATLEYAGTGGRAKFDGNTSGWTILVNNTGVSLDPGLETLQIRNTANSSTAEINKGSVVFSPNASDVAGLTTLNVGYVTSPATDAVVRLGLGSNAPTTVNLAGGIVNITNQAITTCNITGPATLTSAGSITTLNNYAGRVMLLDTGSTIATYVGGPTSTLDNGQDSLVLTFTNCTLSKGATLLDPRGKAVFTNGVILSKCLLSDVTLNLGFNRTVTPQ